MRSFDASRTVAGWAQNAFPLPCRTIGSSGQYPRTRARWSVCQTWRCARNRGKVTEQMRPLKSDPSLAWKSQRLSFLQTATLMESRRTSWTGRFFIILWCLDYRVSRRKRSISVFGIRMWRRAREGRIKPRRIRRRTLLSQIPSIAAVSLSEYPRARPNIAKTIGDTRQSRLTANPIHGRRLVILCLRKWNDVLLPSCFFECFEGR